MADNVVYLDMVTKLEIPAEKILERAMGAGLDQAVVVGVTGDGDFYFASSVADGGDALWLLERAKHKLMLMADEMEAEADETR